MIHVVVITDSQLRQTVLLFSNKLAAKQYAKDINEHTSLNALLFEDQPIISRDDIPHDKLPFAVIAIRSEREERRRTVRA